MTVTASSPSRERIGYLFGHPIAHSMSPLLHQTVYDGVGRNWEQLYLDSTDMLDFLERIKDPRFYGIWSTAAALPWLTPCRRFRDHAA